jgi:dihydrolipoamide dehydrogenase
MSDTYDLIVIGGGPGGYACALRAAQLGLKPAVIEKRATLGGTCLNVGCIPSKALLDSSERFAEMGKLAKHGIIAKDVQLDLAKLLARKDQVVKDLTQGIAGLFRKNKVASVPGTGKLIGAGKVAVTGSDGKTTEISAKNIVIATGSEPVSLQGIPFDGKFVVSSTEALSFDKVPKNLIVVGGGYIGLELGSVWARLGSKVTVLEFLPRILPLSDGELATMVQKSLTKQGLEFHLEAKVTGVAIKGDQALVKAMIKGEEETFAGDRVLMSVGRRPITSGLGLEQAGVPVDAKTGKIVVDPKTLQTIVPGIYALGDVIDGPMLAHKAQMEGESLAERLAGHAAFVNYNAIPSVVYIWPELASVGLTEEQLKEAKREYKVGKFPFLANGRAKCLDETEGVVKLLADSKTDRLLGVHIFGPRASDMIAEAVAVMEYSGSAEDVARICHGHPTLSEAFGEAARHAAFGAPLHL